MKPRALQLGCALLMTALPTLAQDRAELDRTQIIGNRELPKVLTIVPWKKPLPGSLTGRPVHSVLDEALAPLDREVFRRQVDYGLQVQARAAPAVAAVVPLAAAPQAAARPAPAR